MHSPSSHLLRRGRVSEPSRLYLLTTTTHKREPRFDNLRQARIVIQQLRLCEQKGICHSLAWVLMPDHLHWLIELVDSNLSALMCEFKSRASCALYRHGIKQRHIWQPGFHDRALRRDEDVKAVARYIIANPVRAGLVTRAGLYPHWDCVWLQEPR